MQGDFHLKLFIYVLIVVSFLDTFVQLPIISPFAQDIGAGALMIGFIVGLYSLTNMFGNIAAGRWVDRIGAKKIFLLGLFTTGLVLLLYTLVQNPIQLAIIRFIHGLTGGLLVPSIFTYVSHRGRSGSQGKNMAISGAAVGIAAVIGPALGSILKVNMGINAVFIFVAGLMLIGAVISAIFLPENHKKTTKNVEPVLGDQPKQPSKGLKDLFGNKHVVQAYLGAFALMFNMGVVTYMLPLKVRTLHLSDQSSGLLMSMFGLVAILFFILPTNRIFDRFNSSKIMLVGIAVITASMFLLSMFDDHVIMYAIMGLYGIGYAFMFPSMNKLIVDHVPQVDRGKAFGLFYAFYSLGVVVGSFVIGALTESPNRGFFYSALFLIIMGSFVAWQGRNKKVL